MTPFFITGLPRSRTAWLANWLTTATSRCYHEGVLLAKSYAEYRQLMTDAGPSVMACGDSNSSLAFIQEQLIEDFPKARWIIIERRQDHAFLSYRMAFGSLEEHDVSKRKFDKLTLRLLELRRRVPHETFQFDDLNDLETCRGLWFHLFPKAVWFDEARWRLLNGLRVEQFITKHTQAIEQSKKFPWFTELVKKCSGANFP
jgi:hypothetical protein